MYERRMLATLRRRLRERRFIQVLAGPRQTGKTTIARQAMDASPIPARYASADDPATGGATWLEAQWDAARLQLRGRRGALLVLDEIQKIPGWSGVVKRLWDEDSAARRALRVVVLGSAPMLVERGLAESLGGRFEVIRVPHWSLPEMHDAFGFTVDRFVFFGGYPGAAPLIADEERWRRYILDSLVETTISRDVLLMTRVDKPALLRRLFYLGCEYSGQVLSFQKMLGQLQDAGNTTTLAHYLELLAGAGMLVGLQKYAGQAVRRRASSPKLVVLNTALMSAVAGRSFDEARSNRQFWGRLVETAVGAHLINTGGAVDWWREGNREVDYVLRGRGRLTAIEVKTSAPPQTLPGLDEFAKAFRPQRKLIVGPGAIPLEDFLARDAAHWVD